MKWVVRGVLAVFVIVLISAAGIGALLAGFNPNDYKGRIESAVKDSTGRDLALNGEITMTFFPVLGFEAENVEMGNPPGFNSDEFLKVGKAQAGVRVMPLFDRRIELTKIVLNEPMINVIKLAGNKTNLDFSGSEKAEVETASDGTSMDLTIEAIEINNASLTYTDRTAGKKITISPLNLTMPGFTPGEATTATVDLVMKTGDGATTLALEGMARAKAGAEIMSLEDVDLDMTVSSAALADKVHIQLAGAGQLDQKTRNINLNVSKLNMDWRDTAISGSATIEGALSAPSINFSATSSSINLDNLMGAMQKDENNANKNADKPVFPVDALRTLALNGDIAVNSLVFNELEFRDIKVPVKLARGILEAAPLTADFYGGSVEASFWLNANPADPVLRVENTISGVEIGDVLQAKLGDSYITGQGNVYYKMGAAGDTINELKRSVDGTVNLKFGEGYINKWQLSRLLNQAIAFFETGSLAEGAPDKIYFTALDATFNGQNGVFTNNDLVMTGPKVHALGSGVVNVAAQTVDYGLKVGLGTEAGADSRRIPISIKGPLTSPSYSLDTKALVTDTVQRKLQEKLQDKIFGGAASEPAAETVEGEAGAETASGDDTPAPAEETEPASGEEAAKELIKGLFGGQ